MCIFWRFCQLLARSWLPCAPCWVPFWFHVGSRGRPFGSGARLEVEQVDDGGWTPLLHAVHIGHVELVQLLVERGGADVNHVCKAEDARYRGHTPVMHAAMRKHEAVALYLLQAGAAAAQCLPDPNLF